MLKTHDPSTKPEQSIVRLVVHGPNGNRLNVGLNTGSSLLVGSGENCGLRLAGNMISPVHCLLRQIDNQVRVMDWRSVSGTFINGKRIESEITVASGDEIRIGEYSISLDVSPPDGALSEHRKSSEQDAGKGDDQPLPSRTEPQGARQRTSASVAKPTRQATLPPPTAISSKPSSVSGVAAGEQAPVASQQQEMISLLQAEVEQLQLELVERDARLAEAMAWDNECSTAGRLDAEESSETEALANRLDELLDELQSGDERIAVLEEQRRLTEEACEAEREERRQLDAWVNEIELRVAQRDQEREAENQGLRRRLEEATDARSRLEKQLQNAISPDEPGGAPTELLQTLRDENGRLQRRIEEADIARLQLENKVRDMQRQDAPETPAATVDAVLREERIRMAQERATLARQRTKLLELQSELEQRLAKDEKSLDEGDTRLRAFRDHLREIHENEQRARKENSLVNRLARLWNRLDG
jgi:pSer/pThr/pTyr-binding forkhead associated (FHA) protein